MTDPVSVSPMRKWTRIRSFGGIGRDLTNPAIWQTLLLGLVAVAVSFVSIAIAPGAIGFLGAGLALVTIAIAVIDWRSFVIPDWLNAAGLCLAFIHAAAHEPDAVLWAVAIAAIRGAALALVFLALRSAYSWFRGRQGLGLGDVKLAAVAGAWLNWLVIPIAIEIAAVAALSGYVLRGVATGRSICATSKVPFGFFFAPSIWICWVIETIWLAP